MDNPYSAPTSNPAGRESFGFGQEGVTQGVVLQLARTKGWVRFLGVLGLIGAGFMLLAGLGAIAASQAIGKMGQGAAQGPLQGPGFIVAVGVGYIVFGLLFFYPSYKLNKYASAIGRLILSGNGADLENAIEQQRAYWKYIGVIMVLMLLVSVATIAIGVFGATSLFL